MNKTIIIGVNLMAATLIAYPYDWAPGVLDPSCTKAKVCVPGYTKTVRPPESYTSMLKRYQTRIHNIDCSLGCEEDHVVPLEACGHPSDPRNLSPEPAPGWHEKDQVENWWHYEICHGTWTPIDVLHDIGNWQQRYDAGERCSNPNCTGGSL